MGTIRQDSWLCSSQLWPYKFVCGTRGTGILNPKTKFTNFSAQDENKRVGVKPIRTCFELNHVPHDEMPSVYDCRKNVSLVKDSSWKDGREEDPRSDSGCKEPRGMFSACWKRPPYLAKKPGSQAAAHTLGTNCYQRSKCQDEAWSDDDMMMLVAAR